MTAAVDFLVPVEWVATGPIFKYPVAVKVRGGRAEVVKPVRVELSRSGARGMWHFAHGDVDVLIYLHQVCDSVGRYRWTETLWCGLAGELCDKIADAVAEEWRRGGDVEDVIRAIESLDVGL